MSDRIRVALLGGPCDGWKADLIRLPDRILLTRSSQSPRGGLSYSRLDDPDTGEFLGGYVYDDPDAVMQVWAGNPMNAWGNGTARR